VGNLYIKRIKPARGIEELLIKELRNFENSWKLE